MGFKTLVVGCIRLMLRSLDVDVALIGVCCFLVMVIPFITFGKTLYFIYDFYYQNSVLSFDKIKLLLLRE
jgi:hypothetical protein